MGTQVSSRPKERGEEPREGRRMSWREASSKGSTVPCAQER
jgi:hypothetical protein